MTEESFDRQTDELVAIATNTRDADFGSLAMHAALKAAMEDLIMSTETDRGTGHVTTHPRPDPPERSYLTGPEPARGRPRWLLAAAAIAAAVLTVSGVLALQARGPLETTTATDPAPPTTSITEDPELLDRIVTAYEQGYGNNLVRQTTTYGDGRVQAATIDDAGGHTAGSMTGADGSGWDGRTVWEWGAAGLDEDGYTGWVEVDHCDAEYTDASREVMPERMIGNDLRDAVESGRLVIEGTEVKDGRDAIRIVDGTEASSDETLWLDAETLLPFRLEGASGEGHAGGYLITVEFLPRSDDNLAELVVAVPEGYTYVASSEALLSSQTC